MKQLYKRYLIPVVAALICIVFTLIITLPLQWLSELGMHDFNIHLIMVGQHISYLIYGLCIGFTLIVMRLMLKNYSKKERFWCYLIIGFMLWLLSGLLPFISLVFITLFRSVRDVLPITGVTLMVISPINFIQNKFKL